MPDHAPFTYNTIGGCKSRAATPDNAIVEDQNVTLSARNVLDLGFGFVVQVLAMMLSTASGIDATRSRSARVARKLLSAEPKRSGVLAAAEVPMPTRHVLAEAVYRGQRRALARRLMPSRRGIMRRGNLPTKRSEIKNVRAAQVGDILVLDELRFPAALLREIAV